MLNCEGRRRACAVPAPAQSSEGLAAAAAAERRGDRLDSEQRAYHPEVRLRHRERHADRRAGAQRRWCVVVIIVFVSQCLILCISIPV